ncbi:PREDICTED: nucleolar MIF4G domain-containing protein 1 [Eufriesea mexicana]|uniref:nucleolar MIF4G domain-containing protein 1 n=1 Tax=Eufriesea mexicana TaxID=516756 RepID=UPI00083BBCB3|nr:PREDICTED: nucleolar MIF4G domain-containing protein 1 [Eufriesea mexicana]
MRPLKQSKLKAKENLSLKLTEKSRKQMRKELRKQKKVNRLIYSKNKHKLSTCVNVEFDKIVETKDNETNYCNEVTNKTVNVHKKLKRYTRDIKKQEFEEPEFKKRNKKCELLKEANLKEDKVIKKLEKQLKLNKRKKKTIPKSFVTDGLDYLLDFCLEKNRKCILETEKEILENEFNNEFDINFSEIIDENIYTNNKLFCNYKNKSESKSKNESVNDSSKNVPMIASKSKKIKLTRIIKADNININDKDVWEDIYGRKRDKEGNIIYNTNRYIPPAVQKVIMHDINLYDEKLISLKKQLKGCLNRITEHNVYNISNQVETMYMTNSRNNMNNILSELVLESLVSDVITPDRLISEYMMLIAILHANIGIEVGANFVEKLVKRFFDAMEKLQDITKKELDNIVLIISHLYNFKIFGNKLLYQILNKLMIKFTEKEIELILLILKTVGFSLRKDDPNALKEFIKSVQLKASNENGKNSRIKFMLEILLALKNNNFNKIPQYDPSHVEHLKKIIRNVIRKGNTITQFNVSLEDLLYAHENGKWWIIGSAWSDLNNMNSKVNTKENNKFNFGEKILRLAQKQRMNTDIRKNIFCILVTAEDYLDAFEKLHHLGLKDQQEGEIIHVLIHCCLQENKFNPYYAVLAQKLCEYNRKYQLTIQYNFWDKLKTLDIYDNKQLINLAQLLSHLFIEKCLSLSILKIIQFTELDRQTMKFLRQIILGILLHENERSCMQVFERFCISSQLQSFRESLRLFINCFIMKNIYSYYILDEQKIMLKERIELVNKILILNEFKIKF